MVVLAGSRSYGAASSQPLRAERRSIYLQTGSRSHGKMIVTIITAYLSNHVMQSDIGTLDIYWRIPPVRYLHGAPFSSSV